MAVKNRRYITGKDWHWGRHCGRGKKQRKHITNIGYFRVQTASGVQVKSKACPLAKFIPTLVVRKAGGTPKP
jgi:hypothetical protein